MISEILPDRLLLGSFVSLVTLKRELLPRLAVVHCVTRFELETYFKPHPFATEMADAGVPTFLLDIDDHPREAIVSAGLHDAVAFISEMTSPKNNNNNNNNNRIVLVHCSAGKSRSSSVVVAYLMMHEKLSLKSALELVKTRRPLIEPNDGFMDVLIGLEREVFGSTATTTTTTTGTTTTSDNTNAAAVPTAGDVTDGAVADSNNQSNSFKPSFASPREAIAFVASIASEFAHEDFHSEAREKRITALGASAAKFTAEQHAPKSFQDARSRYDDMVMGLVEPPPFFRNGRAEAEREQRLAAAAAGGSNGKLKEGTGADHEDDAAASGIGGGGGTGDVLWCPQPVRVGLDEYFKLSRLDDVLALEGTGDGCGGGGAGGGPTTVATVTAHSGVAVASESGAVKQNASGTTVNANGINNIGGGGGVVGRRHSITEADAVAKYREMVAAAEREIEEEHRARSNPDTARGNGGGVDGHAGDDRDWEKALEAEDDE